MKIRRADSTEAQAIADVWLRSRFASTPQIPPPAHSDDEVRRYFQEVVLGGHVVWVAETNGVILGLLTLDGDWVAQLYVDPEHWGDGVGSQLLAVAKRERPGGLKLWTFQANSGARRFYERHGFVATKCTSGENEEGAPDVLYEWRS